MNQMMGLFGHPMNRSQMEIEYKINRMRIIREPEYWERQIQEFTTHFDKEIFRNIVFGKQDGSNGFSIAFFAREGKRGCLRAFESRDSLLGFVEGYNLAIKPRIGDAI